MQPVLASLVDLLALERLDRDLFRGRSQDLGWGAIFGGQVLGQALSAAAQTVSADRPVHSLHGYFMRAGDVKRPIVYQVDRLRDGATFTTRRVAALQEGEAIFSLEASFQVAEDGFDHQDPVPEVRPPDELRSERDMALAIADQLPPLLRAMAVAERPIEIRPVEVRDPLRPRPAEPRRRMWYRAVDALPDEPALHRYLLAYASDFSFLGTAMDPHGVSWLAPDMQVASLDHVMWFHRPFRFDDWLLYTIDSPSASGGRGLVRGQFFDRAGRLVASAAQEGLIRKRRPR
ncbi:MAG: acyl-CoA thioesterase II [Kofleriaceae bacterium]|jgi:acyl-CoA thioesterase-2|nr:acyl-CoA thioesterase II [Kofleriaceae bacterium]MBP9171747.1 acyl-CoA thioesterase II [Kofleriaceae bacterium]MBP9856344.1 acyl-CoA thioesterase II [Kofleriaceae bacterium]